MNKLKQLKEERASKVEAQGNILKSVEARASKVFEGDEKKQLADLDADIRALDKQIEDAQIVADAQLRQAAQNGAPITPNAGDEPQERYSLHKAIRSGLRNGAEALTGVELQAHNAIAERAAKAGITTSGILIPMASVRASAQTVAEDGGIYGGALVPTEHKGVIDMLNPKPILAQLGATYLRGLTGNLEFTVNEGGIVATWEGEVAQTTATKNKYTKKPMVPKRLSAVTQISKRNLAQSAIDLERYTMSEILGAVERAIDLAGINGSGTGNVPKGILNEADVNVVAIGADGGAITWDVVVDMETQAEIANASTASSRYLINAGTKGNLKKTKHQAGDANYLMTGANEINGYQVGVSNLVPNDLAKGAGTDLSAAIFGDFKEVLIAEWSFLDVTVDDITLADQGQIKLTINMYMDVLVRQPKAFTVVKDIALA